MSIRHQLGFFFTLIYCFVSCSSLKQADSGPMTQKEQREYYASLGSNINRLLEMRQGIFVQHYTTTNAQGDSITKPWMPRETDSLIYVSRRIGNEYKNGHWMCSYAFLSTAPEEPIIIILEKFEASKEDRDLVVSESYEGRGIVAVEDLYREQHDFEEVFTTKLTKLDKQRTFRRQDLLEFTGESNWMEDKRTKNKLERYRKDNYRVRPEHTELHMVFRQDMQAKEILAPSKNYLKRISRRIQDFLQEKE